MAIDRNSDTWKAIERWAAERRALAVAGLITGSQPMQDERNRGEIRALDDLLALASDDPPATNSPHDY